MIALIEFHEAIQQADRRLHNVENEWHYPILTAAGFEAKTKTGVGFVRCYQYVHLTGHIITVTTGVSRDYWHDKTAKATGLWRELEPHLKRLNLT